MRLKFVIASLVHVLGTGAAMAATTTCQNTGSFESWLGAFRQEAAAKGISQATIASALNGMTLDPGIIARDRRQSFFSQTFLQVVDQLATTNRLQNGQQA